MSVPRCATCKHWSADDETVGWEGSSIGMRQCTAAKTRWDLMDGANGGDRHIPDDEGAEVIWIRNRVEALRKARVYVQDGSEYRAEMITGSDFGCVLHSN